MQNIVQPYRIIIKQDPMRCGKEKHVYRYKVSIYKGKPALKVQLVADLLLGRV